MTTQELKLFTKDEIDALPLSELEKYAVKLEWRTGNYDRADLKRYKNSGHPTVYGGTTITSRKQFLAERLKRVKQSKWNPAVKELEDKRRQEEEAREAAKPKVEVTTSVRLLIKLKDCRPKGRTFNIERKGDYVRCGQSPDSKGSAGPTICHQQANYKLADFVQAVKLVTAIKIPEDLVQTEGAKFNASVTLKGQSGSPDGGYPLTLQCDGTKIYIAQTERHVYYNRPLDMWHFNVSDVEQVIEALQKEYDFVVKEKGGEKKYPKEFVDSGIWNTPIKD